ncbi:hypothetical protein BH10BDE1_BH10BDE1_01950 [soil metagenome]
MSNLNSQRNRAWIGVILLLLVVAGSVIQFRRTEKPVTAAVRSHEPAADEFEPMLVGEAQKPSALATQANIRSAPASPESDASLGEIFENDDVCALEKYIRRKREEKNTRSFQSEAESVYFASSPFSENYNEYLVGLSGQPGATTFHGRFLSALRLANWIDDGSKFDGFTDVPRAIDELNKLAHDDMGNAAPAAFAIAISKSIGKPVNDLTAMIRSSDRFNTYQLDYLRSMADFDDPRVTSMLMRVSHHATLAIPNWGLFKSEFVRATESDPELRGFVTDLMMKQAKETKQPSTELGYNVLQAAMARSIAGASRAYPTFKEIDAAFPQTHQGESEKFIRLLSDVAINNCDPKRIESLREFVRELRANNKHSGFAF